MGLASSLRCRWVADVNYPACVCTTVCVCVWEACLCVRNSRWATSVIPYCICFSRPNYKRCFTRLPDVWICISSVHVMLKLFRNILCHCVAALPPLLSSRRCEIKMSAVAVIIICTSTLRRRVGTVQVKKSNYAPSSCSGSSSWTN